MPIRIPQEFVTKYHVAFVMQIVIVLSACAPSESVIQTAIAQTQSVWTPIPSQTPYPTYTPFPTITPKPTATIVPTPDHRSIASNVIAAFKNNGLEADLETENIVQMLPQDYGLAPYVCFGVRFLIPALGPDNGGRIFVCDDPADILALSGYYQALAKGSAALFSWVFIKGNIIVQINGDLPEDKAKQYEAAIP